jgi:hypothetical protein
LAIIIIAMQSIVINIFLAILIWQIYRLVKMTEMEIKPIVKDTQETANTVRGTAGFVSENVVDPVIRASSTVAGYRRAFRSLTADLTPSRRPPSDNGGAG